MADTGNLATALAAFQGSGFAVPRTRTVQVETKKGGTYTFQYAPHELIVAAVRKPLADNGLAVSQPLSVTADGRPALRTILLHTSGERIEDLFPLALSDGMSAQEIGSAITYARRYALSAILGLATEDDDDGNRASGNSILGRTDKPVMRTTDPLIGTAEKGSVSTTDWLIRQSPDGPFLGFRLKDGSPSGFICEARGVIADGLAAFEEGIVGKRVQVWGSFHQYEPPVVKHTYRAFRVERIVTPVVTLPDEATDAPSIPLFDDPELDAVAEALPL